MKIGIDIDGVVSDFVATFIRASKKRYGKTFTRDDIRMHDLFQVLGVKEEEAFALIRETLEHDLSLMPGAKDGLEQLKRAHQIHLLTARPKGMEKTTLEWLDKNKIPYDNLIFLDEGSKYEHVDDFDIVIDDNLEEVIGWVGNAKQVIVFDHPWNQSLNVKDSFIRVHSWEEILKEVNGSGSLPD